MMTINSKEMIAELKKNGFEEIRSNGSHRFFRNNKNGRTTTVPYHNRDLAIGLEKAIRKQAGI